MNSAIRILIVLGIMGTIISEEIKPIEDVVSYAWMKSTEMSFAGNHKLSIEYLDAAIKIMPKHAALYIKRSGEFSRLNLTQKAIADLEFSLTLNPNAIDAIIGLASEYLTNGNKEKSDSYLRKAMDFKPATRYDRMLKDAHLFRFYIKAGKIDKGKEIAQTLHETKEVHGNYEAWLMSDAVFSKHRGEQWFVALIQSLRDE